MSGWDSGVLTGLLLGLFLVLGGFLWVLDPPSGTLARGQAASLTLDYSWADRPVPRPIDWLGGLVLAGIGVLLMIFYRESGPPIYQLMPGGYLLVLALLLLAGRNPRAPRYRRFLYLILCTVFGGALLAIGLFGAPAAGGWTMTTLVDASLALFMYGVSMLLFFYPLDPDAEGDLRRLERRAALTCFVFASVMRFPPGFLHEPAALFCLAGLALAGACAVLVIGPRIEDWRLERFQEAVSRPELGSAFYDEAMHAFEASSPARLQPRRRPALGLILIVFGGLWLALGLTIPR